MLADKPIISTTKKSFVVFTSDADYAPAVQLMNLLTTAAHSEVRALKRFGSSASTPSTVEWLRINAVSTEVQGYFQGAEAAFVFITPADLADTQLTRSLLEVATKAGVRRFAWVAPACPAETELGKHLAQAANLVRTSGLEPPFRTLNCHILLFVIIGRNGSPVFSMFSKLAF